MDFGGSSIKNEPIEAAEPDPVPTPTASELAQQRRITDARRRGRQSLVIEPATNVAGGAGVNVNGA